MLALWRWLLGMLALDLTWLDGEPHDVPMTGDDEAHELHEGDFAILTEYDVAMMKEAARLASIQTVDLDYSELYLDDEDD